jgi:hypothetical protein
MSLWWQTNKRGIEKEEEGEGIIQSVESALAYTHYNDEMALAHLCSSFLSIVLVVYTSCDDCQTYLSKCKSMPNTGTNCN